MPRHFAIIGGPVLRTILRLGLPIFRAAAGLQPSFLQGYGHPVSLFAEYQHTWWQDANFNTPAASPFFNHTFARQDDVVKFGFTVELSPTAPPPVAGPRYVKALPAK